jgi:hypothetical protein
MTRSRPASLLALVRRRLALAAAALALVAAEAPAAPVALVTDVIGDAHSSGEPLRLLAELDPGREIVLQQDASVVVFTLADGSEWVLAGPGRYRLGARGPEPVGGAAPPQRRPGPPAYRDIRLRTDRLQQGGLVLRGRDRLALVAPVQEVVVSPDVRFAWEAPEEDTRFQFELVDQAGQKLLAAETTARELPLPAAVRLQPGQVYYWAVRVPAAGGAPAYRVAEFRVADAATLRRVDAARPRPDAPFPERVLFVALLQQVGARSAADDARRRLAVERPAPWSEPR